MNNRLTSLTLMCMHHIHMPSVSRIVLLRASVLTLSFSSTQLWSCMVWSAWLGWWAYMAWSYFIHLLCIKLCFWGDDIVTLIFSLSFDYGFVITYGMLLFDYTFGARVPKHLIAIGLRRYSNLWKSLSFNWLIGWDSFIYVLKKMWAWQIFFSPSTNHPF